MPRSSNDAEIVQISLGSTACHVAAHWINLQGLSATSLDASAAEPLCCPSIHHLAHSLGRNDCVYVPRAILVDDDPAASPWDPCLEQQQQQPQATLAATSAFLDIPTWSGAIEMLNVGQPPQPQQLQQQSRNSNFRRQAQDLALSAYSRYRVNTQQQQHSNPSSSSTFVSSGRHVNWDEEEQEQQDEQLSEEEEDPEEWRRVREHQRQQEWQRQFRPAQDALEEFWTQGTDGASTIITSTTDVSSSTKDHRTAPMQQSKRSRIHHGTLWREYLMPPLHPQTCLSTPADLDPVVRTYSKTAADHSSSGDWFETVLWERVRRLLEDCDACQGLQLLYSGSGNNDNDDDDDNEDTGAFAGWTTALLREWNDECPHTGRFVLNIQDHHHHSNNVQDNRDHPPNRDDTNPTLPQQQQQQLQKRARQRVQHALQLSDHTELADAVVPLQLPFHQGMDSDSNALVASAAWTAAALECATLPFRLNNSNNNNSSRSRIGMQSYYAGSYSGSQPFGSTNHLSFREFVRNLQRQSASRHVLELDTLVPWSTGSVVDDPTSAGGLYRRLIQGTSLERDQRMRQPGYQDGVHRARDDLPGRWMMMRINPTTMMAEHGGLLTSLSPTVPHVAPEHFDRARHFHYALATSLRPAGSSSAPPSAVSLMQQQQQQQHNYSNPTTSNYVTCLMEGMGIRFRPEQSMATVVDQSLAQLTRDGYGAGSYWKSIFWNAASLNEKDRKHEPTSMPVLATVGNTTRIYPYLHQTAHEAQQTLSRLGGGGHAWFQRDVAQGLLPEADDCREAVSSCWDLRDSYQPPSGSGLIVDEEGTFFAN